jgi:subtilisin family serine protease
VRGAAALTAACLLALLPHQASAAPATDPLRQRQWGLTQLHADTAWKISRGRGVTIAVIDSGADFTHPDLRGALLPGKDFSGSGTVSDDCGHGTQVIGVLAARQGNGLGVAGIAPDAKVLPLKDGASCVVDMNAMTLAIRYAVAAHAKVITISQATLPVYGDAGFMVLQQKAMQAAVDAAWRHGTLVVAAAGNSSLPTCAYPAALRHVICVGSVTVDRTRSYFSQGDATATGDYLVAPGGGQATDPSVEAGIWTTSAAGAADGTIGTGADAAPGYASVSGTSFAAPFVAGVAALLFSRGYPLEEVRRRLLETATDLGPPGRDAIYGSGEVDAGAALR